MLLLLLVLLMLPHHIYIYIIIYIYSHFFGEFSFNCSWCWWHHSFFQSNVKLISQKHNYNMIIKLKPTEYTFNFGVKNHQEGKRRRKNAQKRKVNWKICRTCQIVRLIILFRNCSCSIRFCRRMSSSSPKKLRIILYRRVVTALDSRKFDSFMRDGVYSPSRPHLWFKKIRMGVPSAR